MPYVLTLFDYDQYPPVPLQSMVVGDEVRFYTFYQKNTGITIKHIWETIREFLRVFEEPVYLNDFKSHIKAFGLEQHVDHEVYDLCLPKIKVKPSDERHGKILLAKIMAEVSKLQPQSWQRLLANSMIVYQFLEDQGVRDGFKRKSTIYSLDTYTGRSKTLQFNVQGATDQFDIRPVRDGNFFYIHFDWVAADLRMAAYMSKDEEMFSSFETSDPYARMAEYLNDEEFTRDVCKTQFLRAIYSLDYNNPILDIFPVFKEWMKERVALMRRNAFLDTILGRRFVVEDNELSVFNSQFQGSVAHAMQALLIRLFDRYRLNILAEVHDSIVLCCPENMVGQLIKSVIPIMFDPLRDFVPSSPTMPLKVSIGNSWKKWRVFREYR